MAQVLAKDLKVGDMVQRGRDLALEVVSIRMNREPQGAGVRGVFVELIGMTKTIEYHPEAVIELVELGKLTALLDKSSPQKPELDAARNIMRLEREMNRAIAKLPANCYIKMTVTEYEIGRSHKLPVVTVTVLQDY